MITLNYAVHEFIHALIHADKGIFHLIKALFLNPGLVIREYLGGRRKKYFNPLSFMVITTATNAYLSFKTGYFKSLMSQYSGEVDSELHREVVAIAVGNGKLLEVAVIVPLVTIFSWALFRKPSLNIAEHFVATSFIIGQTNIFKIMLGIPAFLILPSQVTLIDNVIRFLMLIYMTITFWQLYKGHLVSIVVKTILIIVLYLIFYWCAIYAFVWIQEILLKVF